MEIYQKRSFLSFLFIAIATLTYIFYSCISFGSWGEILTTKTALVKLVLAAFLSAFSGFFLVTKGYLWREKFLWKYVIVLSFLLVSLILSLILIDYYTSKEYLFSDFKVMHTQQDVDAFLVHQTEKIATSGAPSLFIIPTGCLLHRIEFNSRGELRIIGYVWQLFDKKTEQFSSNQIFMPEAFEQTVTEVYRFKTDKHLVVGWHMSAKISADYHYVKFPMDKHALLFTFTYKRMDQNVLFVPDFESYDLSKKDAHKHLGIISEGELINWTIYKSDFCYYLPEVSNQYGSTGSMFLQQELPQFSLIVAVERNYAFLLIYSLMPLLVLFFVLFAITLFIGAEKLTLYQVVGLVSTVLFAIVVGQQSYDGSLPDLSKEQSTFIDYVYFIAYFYAFLIAVNGMLYYSTHAFVSFIQYKENLLVRLLYWPILLFFVLIGTFLIFY